MFCPKCGNQISENDRYCYRCGYVINGNKQQADEPNYGYDTGYSDNRRHSNSKRKHDDYDRPSVGLTIIAFLFPLIGLIMYLCMKRDTRRRADSILVSVIVSFGVSVMLSLFVVFIGVLYYTEDGGYVQNSRKHNTDVVNIEEFKAGCEEYSYTDIIRNPDNYTGKNITVHVNVGKRIVNTDNMWTCHGVRDLSDAIIDSNWKFVGFKNDAPVYGIIYELAPGIVTGDNVRIYGTITDVETFSEADDGGYTDMPVIDVIAIDFVNPVD